MAGLKRVVRLHAVAFVWATLLPLLAPVATLRAAWTTVGTGIEYNEYTLPDPNRLFVTRMDRRNPAVMIDSSLGQGRINGGAEIVRSQATRYDDAVTYWGYDWGKRNDVIVAINGDFWNTSTAVPAGGQIITGWYSKDINPSYYFYYTLDGRASISQASLAQLRVTFPASGTQVTIDDVNRARSTNELILYNPHYASTTPSASTGVEVLVELARPNLTSSSSTRGIIRQIRQNVGSTQIPFDHVVLSADGTKATSLLALASIGAQVDLLNFLDSVDKVSPSMAGMGGGEVFLGAGFVWGGQNVKHPRTAVALNDDYVFFVVCDGRSTVSVGMTMTELGNFCKDYLGATWGMNLDGGGSSTMVVNGVVKNNPSDGSERAVANGLMMIVPQTKVQSTTFSSGDRVRTTASSNVRLGPGTNWTSIATVASNTQATILDHSLRGINAKGFNWWKCDFGATIGWVAHTNLALVSVGSLPIISQHPVASYSCPGSSTTFNAAATGVAPFSYQWQRDGVTLSNGGNISGATTAALTVSSLTTADIGSYRCIITDTRGSTTTYSAPLTLRKSTAIVQHPVDATVYPVSSNPTVTFTALGTGEGTVSYQWQRNNLDLANGGHVSGATTPTLMLSNTDSTDRGTYRCRITAFCGSLLTGSATLTVLSPDLDGDNDVDQIDFARLQNCVGISQPAVNAPDCLNADLTGDNHIDTDDVTGFIRCLSGSNQPLLPGC